MTPKVPVIRSQFKYGKREKIVSKQKPDQGKTLLHGVAHQKFNPRESPQFLDLNIRKELNNSIRARSGNKSIHTVRRDGHTIQANFADVQMINDIETVRQEEELSENKNADFPDFLSKTQNQKSLYEPRI